MPFKKLHNNETSLKWDWFRQKIGEGSMCAILSRIEKNAQSVFEEVIGYCADRGNETGSSVFKTFVAFLKEIRSTEMILFDMRFILNRIILED